MYLIAGLGNPGLKYAATKHNVGFWTIDRLAKDLGIEVNKNKNRALLGEGKIGEEKVVLMKPLTYMNLSGEAIGPTLKFYKLETKNLIIVYDDMDLEPGRLRLRSSGSAGGHNGMKSIIAHVGGEQFPRVRIGIGRPPEGWDAADYVMAPFPLAMRETIDQAVIRAAEAVKRIVEAGIDKAMNEFNR